MPSGPVHSYQVDESISNFRGVTCTFSFLFYSKSIFPLANSADPDQTPHSVVSDLGLHCLPMSQKWDARLIWVKNLKKVVLASKNCKRKGNSVDPDRSNLI